MPSAADVAAVVARCEEFLGPRDQWSAPVGYPHSLGLCVLDAVWSMGVRYRGVENVVAAYTAPRRAAGADPLRDNVEDLAVALRAAGGPEAFADALRNHQRTSTRGGVLKAAAVLGCCDALAASGLSTASAARVANSDTLGVAEGAWRRVPGQSSGISWRYLLLLAGRQEVKPDRMVVGFVAAALGRRPAPVEAAELVTAAATPLGVQLRTLDHRIWRFQSGRG